MTQWKYYNHALIPDQAPHLPVDESKIKDGSAFNAKIGGVPMLARWTEGWDLPQETHFWYCIKDDLYQPELLKSNRRYKINKGRKNFSIKIVDPSQYAAELTLVEQAAYKAYPRAYRPKMSSKYLEENFKKVKDSQIIFAAFEKKSNKICGFTRITEHENYADLLQQRTIPKYEPLQINAALVDGVLSYYNSRLVGGFYINDGSRNVAHITMFQDYLEKYFGFHKAYCKLHIKYHPKVEKLIKVLYPFRSIFRKLDSIGKIHQLNAVLKMEEICRADKEVKCTD